MEISPRLPRVRAIVESFEALPDPRLDRTRRHRLADILAIGLCSMLSGAEGFTDMEYIGRSREAWFRTFLELPNGIPSHDTFNRVFSAIDPHCFLDCVIAWTRSVCATLKDAHVAIDGKALRRAADAGKPLPQIVSAWASEAGLALGQVKTDEKSNEIAAVPELLRALELKGCIVTLDAMGCQKEIAGRIAEKGADYVLALKGNQQAARDEVKEYFESKEQIGPPGTMETCDTVEKGHGRIEERRYTQTTDIAWFQDRNAWKKLRSFGMVESARTVKGKRTVERRYYLSSLPLDAKRFGRAVRSHWAIESSLHWSLDVTFNEDRSRARTRHAAQNLALLRRLALSLLKQDKVTRGSLRQRRLLGALDPNYLKTLLGV